MNRFLIAGWLVALAPMAAQAQLGGFRVNARAIQAGKDAVGAVTLSDKQVQDYARQGVEWMDKHNPVAGPTDPYGARLEKLVGKHQNEDGLKLNYKVYKVVDVNAFASADGSVRVFAGLMDILTDDELLGVIGHEIGHVKNNDSKDAMRNALKNSALKNLAASQSAAANQLSNSELGQLAEGMLGASYSRKQESEADEYGYAFMKKHGYNVVAMATAFEKLAKLSEGSPQASKLEKMMSSHPDSGKRAKTIRDRAKKDGLGQ